MLGEITPQNLPMFLMSNPELVPGKYAKKFQKSITNLGTYLVFGTVGGITANVQIKRLSMKFLRLPGFVRLPMRLGIFALPFGLLYPKISHNMEDLTQTLFRVHLKILKLHKTGNIHEYFKEN